MAIGAMAALAPILMKGAGALGDSGVGSGLAGLLGGAEGAGGGLAGLLGGGGGGGPMQAAQAALGAQVGFFPPGSGPSVAPAAAGPSKFGNIMGHINRGLGTAGLGLAGNANPFLSGLGGGLSPLALGQGGLLDFNNRPEEKKNDSPKTDDRSNASREFQKQILGILKSGGFNSIGDFGRGKPAGVMMGGPR